MSRHGSKKLPLDGIREALLDSRVWCALGVVTLFDGESSHYEIEDGDILVDVKLVPNGEPLLCRLGAGAVGGVWQIPPVGAEVIVAIPEGDFEANPTIVACLIQTYPHGINETTVIIQVPEGATLKVHDGDSGEVDSLATKSDIDALQEWALNHAHTEVTTGAGTSGPPAVSPPGAAGTSVLKAK